MNVLKHFSCVNSVFEGVNREQDGKKFQPSPPDEDMSSLETQNLVETTSTGEGSPRPWREWMTAHQQQAAEKQQLFQLMANQQKARLDQMALAQV